MIGHCRVYHAKGCVLIPVTSSFRRVCIMSCDMISGPQLIIKNEPRMDSVIAWLGRS